MERRVEFTWERAEFLRAGWVMNRMHLLLVGLVGLLLVVLGLLMWSAWSALLIGIGMLLPLARVIGIHRGLRGYWHGRPGVREPWRCAWTDESIAVDSATSSHMYRRGSLASVEQRVGVLFLSISPYVAIAIPERAFASDDQLRDLLTVGRSLSVGQHRPSD